MPLLLLFFFIRPTMLFRGTVVFVCWLAELLLLGRENPYDD